MASMSSIAIDKATARENTEQAIKVIAKQLGLDVPNFEVHKRYPLDYRNAKKDLAISEFFMQIANAMETKSVVPPKTKRKVK